MEKNTSFLVKIYTQRSHNPTIPIPAKEIELVDIEIGETLTHNGRSSALCSYSHKDVGVSTREISFMGIQETISEDCELIAVPIHIPSFFEEVKSSQSHTGIFLANINGSIQKKAPKSDKKPASSIKSFRDPSCKGLGSWDCPKRLILGSKKGISHFTFNGQVFFPLLMRNFVTMYYVADESSKKYNWDFNQKPDDDANYGSGDVAVNGPIWFEPSLGIFMTRNAEKV